MILKYNIQIKNNDIGNRIQVLINQIYKLLPTREQGKNWEKPLETIIEELNGMYRLMNYNYSNIFFPLLNKLEGLFTLISESSKNFNCYRRTIFQCLSLMNQLREEICHQNY